MKIKEIVSEIERLAPLSLQEGFDNAGIQVGDVSREATAALLCLDVTEAVVDEALEKGCNLIISHHPLAFKPFKSLTGSTYIERCLIKACKHDLVIYAAHTNRDNATEGVNYRLAELIGLQQVRILSPLNTEDNVGSGIVGELPESEEAHSFLHRIKELFQVASVKHSAFTPGKRIRRVAVCGGSGAFLIPEALASGADVFITGEAKYNDFYDVENNILLTVIGHYESEICTKDIFRTLLSKKFPAFPLFLSEVDLNPVKYV